MTAKKEQRFDLESELRKTLTLQLDFDIAVDVDDVGLVLGNGLVAFLVHLLQLDEKPRLFDWFRGKIEKPGIKRRNSRTGQP